MKILSSTSVVTMSTNKLFDEIVSSDCIKVNDAIVSFSHQNIDGTITLMTHANPGDIKETKYLINNFTLDKVEVSDNEVKCKDTTGNILSITLWTELPHKIQLKI